jgi:hypothetical protein
MRNPSELLEAVLADVEKRTQLLQYQSNEQYFPVCVEAWCELLEWPDEVANLALQLLPWYTARLGHVAARVVAEVVERKKSSGWTEELRSTVATKILPKQGADYAVAIKGAMRKMETRHQLLIALAVAAVAYAGYRYRSTQKNSRQKSSGSIPIEEPTRKVLVLVINASHQSVIGSLRAGEGPALQGDQLYDATQALWFGSEADFARFGFAQWFSKDREVTTPSEYDVHLIRLDIAADDAGAGFRRSANQLDRLDAFRRLQETGLKVEVSPRLPSDAYGTADLFYKR